MKKKKKEKSLRSQIAVKNLKLQWDTSGSEFWNFKVPRHKTTARIVECRSGGTAIRRIKIADAAHPTNFGELLSCDLVQA